MKIQPLFLVPGKSVPALFPTPKTIFDYYHMSPTPGRDSLDTARIHSPQKWGDLPGIATDIFSRVCGRSPASNHLNNEAVFFDTCWNNSKQEIACCLVYAADFVADY